MKLQLFLVVSPFVFSHGKNTMFRPRLPLDRSVALDRLERLERLERWPRAAVALVALRAPGGGGAEWGIN